MGCPTCRHEDGRTNGDAHHARRHNCDGAVDGSAPLPYLASRRVTENAIEAIAKANGSSLAQAFDYLRNEALDAVVGRWSDLPPSFVHEIFWYELR